MPVDLSRIGLEGIETAQRTLNSIEARKASQVAREVEAGKFQREEADLALDRLAGEHAARILGGDPQTGELSSLKDVSAEDYLQTVADFYAEAGAPKKASEFYKAELDLAKKRSDIDKAEDEAEKTRLENMEKAADWVGQNIGENENEYSAFLSDLNNPDNPVAEILGRQNVEALQNTAWSPELANYFRSKALSIKEQAALALQERSVNRAERALESSERHREVLTRIAQQNADVNKRREDRLAKAGGTSAATAPKPAEISAAKNAILNGIKDFGGTWPQENTPEEVLLGAVAVDIASRATQIVGEGKGLSYGEALSQAVAEAELAGDFEPAKMRETTSLLGIPIKSRTFDKPGYKRKGTKANPLPLTPDVKPVKGRYYIYKGKVEQYTGE